MAVNGPQGYTGKNLRVNLTTGKITEESLGEDVLRKYLGGLGIGAYYLYKEVPAGVGWADPANRLIIGTGPLTGTAIGGSGGFAVVTKGALTDGATAAAANGFLGSYLKFCGYDAVIFEGKSSKPVYLHVRDGGAELKSAAHLTGKDTLETQELIRKDLDKTVRQISVYAIGVAGEKGVRFACMVGDGGHVPAHGGAGAVMGAKNLKAIAVERGKGKVPIANKEAFGEITKGLFEKTTSRDAAEHYKWGPLGQKAKAATRLKNGYLPVKNYSTNIFPEGDKYYEEFVRTSPQFKLTREPCWACRFDHCHKLEIVEGPYKGFSGEEPEYELWAGFGSLIGNTDWSAAAVIANEVDRLGMDGNESAWLTAWVIECYEKGLIDRKMTGGLEMKWGNTEAVIPFLRMVANRKGFGDILAGGVMRAAEHMGGEAQKMAVYTRSGNTPRMHDHRCTWPMIVDTVTSTRGRDMDGALVFGDESLFTAEGAANALVKVRGRHTFTDSLVVCKFNILGLSRKELADMLNAATGWDLTEEEIGQMMLRLTHLLRAFDVRQGRTPEKDAPSFRYASAPVDGPNVGKSLGVVWDKTLEAYYKGMGWDTKTGKPLAETLKKVGLESVANDLWSDK